MKDNRGQIVKALKRADLGVLNAEQVRLLDIYNMADDLIKLHGPGKDTTTMLMTVYEAKYNEALGRSMAYVHIQNAQTVLGSQCVFDKPYWRGFLMERVVRLIARLEAQIYQDQDLMDDKLTKELIKAYERLGELMQLHKDEKAYDPDEDVDTVVITDKASEVGYTDYIELSEEVEQKLLDMGVKKDKSGGWN